MRESRVSATDRPPWHRTVIELSSANRRSRAEGTAPTGETPCRYRIQIPLRMGNGFWVYGNNATKPASGPDQRMQNRLFPLYLVPEQLLPQLAVASSSSRSASRGPPTRI